MIGSTIRAAAPEHSANSRCWHGLSPSKISKPISPILAPFHGVSPQI
jgi:hypothetical protein